MRNFVRFSLVAAVIALSLWLPVRAAHACSFCSVMQGQACRNGTIAPCTADCNDPDTWFGTCQCVGGHWACQW